jgi:cellulose synthase/poly-beta-1,6-N-acetylglucosamine synthase-like glycosyltransferase
VEEIRIAAIIPAYNEELLIGKTLASLQKSGIRPKDIYVINDGSGDETAKIARQYSVNVLHNPGKQNCGKANSVNYALKTHSLLNRYTHICFLDADTLVSTGYFRAVRNRLKTNPDTGVICGRPKSLPKNWLTAWRAFQYFMADAVFKPAQSRMRAITVVPGCAATYSVGALKKITWSDDTPTEDLDVTIQAVLNNEKIYYEKDAIVYTQDPSKLNNYVGQVYYRWHAGNWQVMRKYGLLWNGWNRSFNWVCRLVFLEPFFYFGLLIYYFAFKGSLLQALASMIILPAVFSAAGAWREKRMDIFLYFPLYPFMWLLDLMLFFMASRNLITGPEQKGRKREWYSIPRYHIERWEAK